VRQSVGYVIDGDAEEGGGRCPVRWRAWGLRRGGGCVVQEASAEAQLRGQQLAEQGARLAEQEALVVEIVAEHAEVSARPRSVGKGVGKRRWTCLVA
jgi:hypothetical protein